MTHDTIHEKISEKFNIHASDCCTHCKYAVSLNLARGYSLICMHPKIVDFVWKTLGTGKLILDDLAMCSHDSCELYKRQ